MDKREFWTKKSPLAEYHGIVFSHPAFSAPFRLVANQFAAVTLGGHEHTPAPMTIKPPDQRGDAQPKLTLAFPRIVVGREFKRQLRLIEAAGLRDPIAVTYSVYLGVTDVPQVTWSLYASDTGGIQFTTDTVQVSATIDNPMRRAVAPIYDPAVFTGLELI
jgi:hypothetical protein